MTRKLMDAKRTLLQRVFSTFRKELAKQDVAFGLLFCMGKAGDSFIIISEEITHHHKVEMLRDALDAVQKALTLEETSTPHKLQ